jgi:hypothetical protein
MALRRYQHKFPQPLEIDQERVASSLNTNLTATNLTVTNSTVTTQTVSKLSTNNFFNSATPDYTPSFEALAILGDPTVTQGAIAHIRNNNVSVNDADVFGGLKFFSSPGADFIIGKSTQSGSGFLQVRRENGTTLVSMDGSGNFTLNSGNLVIGTSGKGIDFSANANAAGMTSELLDDYERGTFTPTLVNAGTPTYTNQLGEYVKIGSSVFINVYISYTGATPGVNSRLSGLPFAMTDSAVKVLGWATQTNTGSTVYLVTTTGLSTTQLYVNPLTSQVAYGFYASIQITTLS